ncbi:hypothetical protein POM88_002090 [Heracleum sosnowskyi]|uniref:Uncharacterized protein n=1 Tax=Heracleum sosnowskyi TaxID=360622 RepID=A0AAD8JDG4_9APIA|nr:hypothetical protein POM88_002090 [Heracleum sosnowskyi]
MNTNASSSSGTTAAAAAYQTQATENVYFNVTGVDVHFGVVCPHKPRPISQILAKVEKHGLRVQATALPGDHIKSLFIIHARDAREGIAKVIPLKVQCNMAAKDIQSLI